MTKATKQLSKQPKTRKPAKKGKRKQAAKPLLAAPPAVKRAAATKPRKRAKRPERTGLRAAPTYLGLQLLALIAETKQGWRNPPDEATDPEGYNEFSHRMHFVVFPKAKRVAAKIAKAPLRTLSDVVDRAIVLAWDKAADGQDEPYVYGEDLLAPILAIGGITLDECDESAEPA